MKSNPNLSPLSPHLGVILHDIDPSYPLSESQAAQLDEAIDKHHLVLLKSKQLIKPEQQVAFTQQLGETWSYDYVKGQYKAYPEIFKVTNQDGNGFTNVGQAWHADGSIYNLKMHLSIFSIQQIPLGGASTYFSNLFYALERLSDEKRKELKNIDATFGKRYRAHPSVWKHPVLQKDVLHVSQGFNAGFRTADKGIILNDNAAQELRTFFNEHMWEEGTYYEHQWEIGDLVIADNYAVAHYAKPTHTNTLRILHRTATKGVRHTEIKTT